MQVKRVVRPLCATALLLLGSACSQDASPASAPLSQAVSAAEGRPSAPGNVAESSPGAVAAVAAAPAAAAARAALPDRAQAPLVAKYPAQQENRRIFKSPEELPPRGPKQKEDKEKQFTAPSEAPPASETLSGAEYRRRADEYLAQWNKRSGDYANSSPQETEAAKSALKREIIGE